MARRRKDLFMKGHRHGKGSLPPFLRKTLLFSLALMAAFLLLGFIGYAQLLSYLQGESFRDSLEKVIAEKAQASSATIDDTLSLSGNQVSLQGISVQRPSFPQGIEGRRIHAELVRGALLDKELHLTRLMVEEGALTLNLDRKGKTHTRRQKKAQNFFSRLAPTHARLDRVDCKDFHVSLHLDGRNYTLSDSSLSANPAPQRGKDNWEFRLSNGRVHTPLPVIGDSSLKNATLTLGETHATLSDARLMLSPGELIVNAVREQSSGNWSADIRANSMDVSRLIGEDWKKRITGVLYGRLRADGDAAGLAQAEGRLSLQQGIMEALPFLENLPVGDSYPYRSLRIEKATARLSYPHEDAARNIRHAWLLDQIDLRSEGGWLRIKGHAFADADGSLGGSLLIGLPETLATKLAPAESSLHRSIFNAEGEAGYLWLRLNLSGSVREPQEDLSVRLMTLISSALPDAANTLRSILLPRHATPPAEDNAPAEESSKPAAPEPTKSAGGLIEEAGKAAGDIISTGLRSFF